MRVKTNLVLGDGGSIQPSAINRDEKRGSCLRFWSLSGQNETLKRKSHSRFLHPE